MLNIRNNKEPFQQGIEVPAEPPTVTSPNASSHDTPVSSVESREAPHTDTIANALNRPGETSQVLSLEPLSFGEMLRNLRAEAGMTVADVALKVRSSQAFILNLESGDFHKIRQHDHYCKSFIERICLVYQAEPDELLEKFEQESRSAARLAGRFVEDSQQGSLSGGYVFADEDLTEEKPVSAALHVPAVLISVLVVMLAVLLISAWAVKKVRERKNVERLRVIENDLPALITPKQVPLEVLPIPNH